MSQISQKHIRSIEVNNTLFKYIYAHKRDTRYIFETVDREDPYKRSPKVGAFPSYFIC